MCHFWPTSTVRDAEAPSSEDRKTEQPRLDESHDISANDGHAEPFESFVVEEHTALDGQTLTCERWHTPSTALEDHIDGFSHRISPLYMAKLTHCQCFWSS